MEGDDPLEQEAPPLSPPQSPVRADELQSSIAAAGLGEPDQATSGRPEVGPLTSTWPALVGFEEEGLRQEA